MWDLSKTRDIHFYEVYNEDLNDFETEGVILKCRERIWYYYFLEEWMVGWLKQEAEDYS